MTKAPAALRIANLYRDRCARTEEDLGEVRRRSRLIANVRLLVFVLIVLVLGWGEVTEASMTGVALAVIPLAVGFAVLVGLHARVKKRMRWLDAYWAVNDEAAKRVERRWDQLPIAVGWDAPPDHPYAGDLDLFGRASLFQLLGTVTTVPGRHALSTWLLESSPLDVIRRRQEAVAELAPRLDWRQRYEVAGRLVGDSSLSGLEQFFSWAEEDSWLDEHRWLLPVARVTPATIVALAALQFAGVVPSALWLLPLVANIALSAWTRRRIHATYRRALANEASYQAYAEMMRLIGDEAFASSFARDTGRALARDGAHAHVELRRLHRDLALADTRFAMVYPIIQALTLWDVHVLARLERWQRRCGRSVRAWLTAVGELEALCALASLSHDNPEWALPTFVDGLPRRIGAAGLAHPLLPSDVGVENDVEIPPAGSFLLVTGSNMSGKSTLLRAVGVNVVLAQAGGPVCAASLELPPVTLYTSMRIQDSLDQGVSYFMAGLRRLKQIVDAARSAPPEDDRSILFLLDEILQGTNTAERQIAVRGILRELLKRKAIGAVTTHDLGLADAPELREAQRAVHFSETIHRDADRTTMSFDYRLRPGVAQSRNALALMDMMGLGVEYR